MLTVYSKENCPACIKAKSYLDERGVEYKVIMIVFESAKDESEINREEFLEKNPTARNVPYMVDENGAIYRTVAELMQAF